jgi:hypothetical protein
MSSGHTIYSVSDNFSNLQLESREATSVESQTKTTKTHTHYPSV